MPVVRSKTIAGVTMRDLRRLCNRLRFDATQGDNLLLDLR